MMKRKRRDSARPRFTHTRPYLHSLLSEDGLDFLPRLGTGRPRPVDVQPARPPLRRGSGAGRGAWPDADHTPTRRRVREGRTGGPASVHSETKPRFFFLNAKTQIKTTFCEKYAGQRARRRGRAWRGVRLASGPKMCVVERSKAGWRGETAPPQNTRAPRHRSLPLSPPPPHHQPPPPPRPPNPAAPPPAPRPGSWCLSLLWARPSRPRLDWLPGRALMQRPSVFSSSATGAAPAPPTRPLSPTPWGRELPRLALPPWP